MLILILLGCDPGSTVTAPADECAPYDPSRGELECEPMGLCCTADGACIVRTEAGDEYPREADQALICQHCTMDTATAAELCPGA